MSEYELTLLADGLGCTRDELIEAMAAAFEDMVDE
jgi:hypothetical protein